MTDETAPADPITFDLLAAIQGITYPEAEVKLYFDHAAAARISGIEDLLADAEARDDEEAVAEATALLKKVVAAVGASEYTVTVRGIPQAAHEEIVASVDQEHPAEFDSFRRKTSYPERDEALTLALWQAYIVKVTNHEGAVVENVPPEFVAQFKASAPGSMIVRLIEAINTLQEDRSSAYETYITGTDFLSQP